MRKNILFSLAAGLLLSIASGCSEQKSVKKQMDEASTMCYFAVDRTDSAWLKLDTSDRKHVLGELLFIYENDKRYEGMIKAVMEEDTIKGNYSFKINNVDKWYKNPIALLKKGNTLTLGIGEIYTLWGSGFFLKTVPIAYDRGRFVFKQVGCSITR